MQAAVARNSQVCLHAGQVHKDAACRVSKRLNAHTCDITSHHTSSVPEAIVSSAANVTSHWYANHHRVKKPVKKLNKLVTSSIHSIRSACKKLECGSVCVRQCHRRNEDTASGPKAIASGRNLECIGRKEHPFRLAVHRLNAIQNYYYSYSIFEKYYSKRREDE